jgi:hypothetical protein
LKSKRYKPKGRENIQRIDLEDGCVLYDREKKVTYTLNSTASLFWFYIDGKLTLEQIAREISLTTDVKAEEVLDDFIKTSIFFQENDLIEAAS